MSTYDPGDKRDHDRATRLALDLINSYDPYFAEPEQLLTTRDLIAFLEEHDVRTEQLPREDDLVALREVRGALRRAYEARHGEGGAAALNTLLATATAEPAVAPTFEVTWRVDDQLPLAVRLGTEATLGLANALREFGPDRVKECAADPCQLLFIDRSRNRSRRFCDERCANRYHVAKFRDRQRPS